MKKATAARRARRTHCPALKAKVALGALRDDKPLAQLCQDYDLHGNQVLKRKTQRIEHAGG